ncbi:MAG TPA: hypothetical protein VGO96_03335, partial [Pyrinomonadaceae bacterium]|nr:hypothetical protein [Pyrinomonadaceae bacterium]
IFGLAGGLTACLFATTFAVLGWLARPGVAATYLQRYSTVLFVLVIPLLLFGAHCLDLQDRKTHPPTPRPASSPPTNPPAHTSHRTANPPRTAQPPTERGE